MILLCFSLLGNGNGNGNGADAIDSLLTSIDDHYRSVEDLTANFVQNSRVASLGRDEEATGIVWVKRPGRMRWEYSAPEERVIAIDSETLRMYSPSDRQMQVASLVQGALSPTALDFLLGDTRLVERFTAEQLPSLADGTLRIELRPRDDARFEKLELWVAPMTYHLRGSVLVDVLGNRTEVRFSALRENSKVDDDRFLITVPSGTEVIDLRVAP